MLYVWTVFMILGMIGIGISAGLACCLVLNA